MSKISPKSKNEKQIIYLMLNSKEAIQKVIDKGITAKYFEQDHQPIIEKIFESYEDDVLLTRQTYLHSLKADSPKDKIAQELTFNSCCVAKSDENNLSLYLGILVDKHMEAGVSVALDLFKRDRDEKGILVANANLAARLAALQPQEPAETEPTFLDTVKPYKDYPISIFKSKDLQTQIKTVSDDMGVPVEWASGPVMAICSALLGNKVRLKTGFRHWMARPYYSFVSVGKTGVSKSHIQALVLGYISQLDRVELKKYKELVKLWEAAEKAKKKDDTSVLPDKPIRKRYLVSDITIEQHHRINEEDKMGHLHYVDEFAGFIESLGQYKGGKGNDLSHTISMLDGRDYKVCRAEQDRDIFSPFVVPLGTIQPEVIKEITTERMHIQGFPYRLMFSYPVFDRKPITKNSVSESYLLTSFFERMNITPNFNEFDTITPYIYTYDSEAQALAEKLKDGLEQLKEDFEDDSLACGIIPKIDTCFINCCLLLHCINSADMLADRTITADTVKRAYRLAMYHAYHNYITLSVAGCGCDDRMIKIAKWLKKNKVDSMPISRMIQNKLFDKADEAREYLKDKGTIADGKFKLSA